MKQYQAGIRTTNGTTTEASLEIIAGARGFRLVGIFGVALAAATASVFGIGRPAALGVTPTSPLSLKAAIDGTDSLAKTALAWGTSPTVPAAFRFRISLPATIGAFRDLPMPSEGIWVPAGTSLVLWNIGAVGVSDVHFTIME